MPQISRPAKQGGATTYGGKVSAGYTTILASEMDADLDTIYSAWNSGVDGTNIQPASITGDKLAPGAVGSRELANSGVATVDLADSAVTTLKIADASVTQAKLAAGVTAIPSGPAGGTYLTGTYPNPDIVSGSITNTQLANRASTRYGASAVFPASWTTPGTGAWYQVATVGVIPPYANATIFIFGTGSALAFVGSGTAYWRVRRDAIDFGAVSNQAIYRGYSNSGPMMINFALYDTNAPAGTHNYTLEVYCTSGAISFDAQQNQCGYMHVWVMA